MSRRMNMLRKATEKLNSYTIKQALELVKAGSGVKFNETVDISLLLGVDSRQAEQNIRGTTELPHGHGKKVIVAAFVEQELEQTALEAGADIVGLDELIRNFEKGSIVCNKTICTPNVLPKISKIGKILASKNMMPSMKLKTVSEDLKYTVNSIKTKQVFFRADKSGIINTSIGKINLSCEALEENLFVLLKDILKLRPVNAKGQYLKQLCISSTMGLGFRIKKEAIKW